MFFDWCLLSEKPGKVTFERYLVGEVGLLSTTSGTTAIGSIP